MSMNFSLAREIYGITPFCVDSHTLPAMMSILNDFKNGVTYSSDAKKNSNFSIITKNETKLVQRPFELNTSEDFEGVALININGPILVNSGASTIGMREVSEMMTQMSNDSRIKGFILLVDSGGGATAAVEIMINTISEIKSKGKKIFTLIDKGGVLASAAYGIASATNGIYYQSPMSIVGSLGTMIQFNGREANSQQDGVKFIRLYATKSVNKNIDIENALNKDEYQVLINDLLDPINERFIDLLKENRSQLTEAQLDGSEVFAKDDKGIFTDGVSNLETLIDDIISSNSNSFNNNNLIQNSNKMTKSELKSQHPELFNEVYSAGVTAESERVQSWLAHVETDQEAVMTGIESGSEISPSQREKLLVKANKTAKLQSVEGENADDFTTGESTINAGEDELENVFKQVKLK